MSAEAATILPSPALSRTRSRFFQIMTGVLLAIVIGGFLRSFFLRPLFLSTPLAPALILHGSLLTVWFLLLFAQSTLIAAGRAQVHRALGYAGAVWALVIVGSGAIANLGMARRVASLADREHMIVWGNVLTLLAFAGLIIAAVLKRNSAPAHRRYMLLASIAIIGPPLGRIPDLPGMPGGPPFAVAYAIGGILLLLGAVVIHDLGSIRRVHAATWTGGAVTLASIVGTVVVGTSPAAFRLLQALVH